MGKGKDTGNSCGYGLCLFLSHLSIELMQIQCHQIIIENVRLDVPKNVLNIIRIDGCCEVIVDGCVTIPTNVQEHR